MVEVVVTAIAVVVGLVYTARSMLRIHREAQVVTELKLPEGSPEWVLVREKLITMTLVGIGLVLMVIAVILVLATERPRPPLVAAVITWSIVSMPVLLAALAVHAERSYWAERDALTEKRDALDILETELHSKEENS